MTRFIFAAKAVRVVLFLIVLADRASAGCAITTADYNKIKQGLATPNFFGFFNNSGDCKTAAQGGSGLRALYGDCGTTFETVLSQQGVSSTCRTDISSSFYLDNGALDASKTINKAIDVCGKTLGTVVNTFLCDPSEVPGCPNFLVIGKFAAVVRCFAGNITLAQRISLFATGDDITCMRSSDFCSQFNPFESCLNSVTDIINFVYTNNQYECTGLFEGATDVNQRCAQSISDMYYYYCPKQSFLQKNLIALAAGIPAGVIGLAVIIFCCIKVRSGYISDREVIAGIHESPFLGKQRDSAGINLPIEKQIHPELAAVMEKKSKYRGITFDINNKMWRSNATGQLFATEMEAAQAAYLAQVNAGSPRLGKAPSFLTQFSSSALVSQSSSPKLTSSPPLNSSPILTNQNSFSNASPIAAYIAEPEYKVETSDEKRERRIRQLINFYEYWDADKDDIPGHVDHLFKRHDFTYIARAVKTKYGLVPPGWEEELEAERA